LNGGSGVTSRFEFEDDELTAVVKAADLRPPPSRRAAVYHLLVHVQGTEMGRVRCLERDQVLLGRSADADIIINDDGVSRRHALLVKEGPAYTISDLNSANGTWVQGVRLTGPRALDEGDRIQIGPTFLLRYTVTDADQKALLEKLYATSVTDALTGARNREYLDSLLAAEISYARRHGSDLAFVLFDLDHFKSVNDTHGHPAGDTVLAAVAEAVRVEVRKEDALCRYGGEEFALVLRDIDRAGAAAMGERVRALIEGLHVHHEGVRIAVTASVGVATVRELNDATSSEIVRIADQRLYRAKHGGRNRVVSAD
jgi:two-component system, cell cycle response regulator